MDRDYLKKRLSQIVDETRGAKAIPPSSWWVGDKTGALQVIDDARSGRMTWRAAHNNAISGLKAIEEDDFETAELLLRQAESFLLNSLKAQMRPANYADLISPAKARGRRRSIGERKKRYLELFEKEKERGVSDPLARKAALKADPEIASEFAGTGDKTLRTAIRDAMAARKLEEK